MISSSEAVRTANLGLAAYLYSESYALERVTVSTGRLSFVLSGPDIKAWAKKYSPKGQAPDAAELSSLLFCVAHRLNPLDETVTIEGAGA